MMTMLTALMSMNLSEAAAVENRSYFPPVLIYHDIKAQVVMPDFDVSLAEFRYQLDWLKSHGFKTLSTEEFLSYIERGEPFPKKSILITFDDAYGGNIRYAAPELEARGMSAVFFVIVDSIGKTLSRQYYHATAKELRQLATNPNFALESHTLTHPHLDQLSSEALNRELTESKALIEELSGRSVRLFSYPYGDYNGDVIDAVIEAGYSAAFIVDVLESGTFDRPARYSIPRINMGQAVGDIGHRWFKKMLRHRKPMSDEEFASRWVASPYE